MQPDTRFLAQLESPVRTTDSESVEMRPRSGSITWEDISARQVQLIHTLSIVAAVYIAR